MISLYNEDNKITLNRIKDNSIDLIVTSPPYYVGKEYEDQNKTQEGWEKYIKELSDFFIDCNRVLKEGSHIWINIDDPHTNLKSSFKKNKCLPNHAILISELHNIYDYKEMILWKKIRSSNASGGSGRMLGSYGRFGSPGSIPIVQDCEYILWFKKQGKRENITDEMRKSSCLTDEEFKVFGKQIWDFKPERSSKLGHPATFPLELPYRIIKMSTFIGDTVFDPFSGVFTTGLACKSLGRNFIGSEINKDYFEIGYQRVNSYLIKEY